MKIILPRFYNNFINIVEIVNNYHYSKNINIIGVQDAFLGSYFQGGVNIHRRETACLFDTMQGCLKAYNMLDMIILDFGNPLITSSDFYNRFAAIQFSSFSDNDNIYFSIGNKEFVHYIINTYPTCKILLHQNYIDYADIEQIQELINTYPNNIKGIVTTNLNLLQQIDVEIKIYNIPLYSCHNCNHYKKCQKNEWEAILEFSEKSYFRDCPLFSDIPVHDNVFPEDDNIIISFSDPQRDTMYYTQQIKTYLDRLEHNNDKV